MPLQTVRVLGESALLRCKRSPGCRLVRLVFLFRPPWCQKRQGSMDNIGIEVVGWWGRLSQELLGLPSSMPVKQFKNSTIGIGFVNQRRYIRWSAELDGCPITLPGRIITTNDTSFLCGALDQACPALSVDSLLKVADKVPRPEAPHPVSRPKLELAPPDLPFFRPALRGNLSRFE